MTSERGVVGGVEVLPFAILIFVAGTLLITSAWGVVDTKAAVSAAAREGVRAQVEATPSPDATIVGRRAAIASYASGGRNPDRLEIAIIDPGSGRCGVLRYEVRATVPAVRMPFTRGFGDGTTVVGRHSEVVDPFAAGLTGSADCAP